MSEQQAGLGVWLSQSEQLVPAVDNNGILRDTPKPMMMCFSSLPLCSARFQLSFPRWFFCWILMLAVFSPTLAFPLGRSKSLQGGSVKSDEKVQKGTSEGSSQAGGDSNPAQQELEKALQEFR